MSQKWTNKHNLPEEIVSAITKDRYTDTSEKPSDYSATTLLAPVQQVVLKKRYEDSLKIRDVVDDFWAFLGSIAHNVLEESWHESMGSVVEDRLYTNVGDKVLSGKMDCYHNGEIRDYKTTKAYKIIKGDYYEYEKQLNIYAFLCKSNGFEVNSLKVIAIIFDWQKHKVGSKNYPECPFVIIPLRLWEDDEVERYIKHRVSMLNTAWGLSDSEIAEKYPCSDRDMWQDTKDFAVIKSGATRATRSFGTEEEAYEHLHAMKNQGDYIVLERKTGRKRCQDWCDCAHLCVQNKNLIQGEGGDWYGEELESKPLF